VLKHAATRAGFTLIEVLFTVAVLGLLVMMAMPTFGEWLQSQQLRAAAEASVNGLQLARAEAIRRNLPVQITFGVPQSGWQIVEAAESEREEAFAYGYVSHLAGDVYSHNHYVPVQLVVSYQARTLRHIYWEARFDAAQERDRWRLVRTVMRHRYRDLDRLVERVVERTLFSFKTNKRIFDSVMALQQIEQWQVMVKGLGERSRYPLPQADVDRFNGLCVSAIQDMLLHGHESACQHADPTGREAIAQANLLRRKLRALKRKGEVPEAIVAEIRALAHSAA